MMEETIINHDDCAIHAVSKIRYNLHTFPTLRWMHRDKVMKFIGLKSKIAFPAGVQI